MNSFIYLYSKFTEELLLLGAAAIFTLLAVYCYEWVIKKRRLGAARNQIPASMVKVYLNQLINEAQFVRTQLFGLMNGTPTEGFELPRVQGVSGVESHESPAAQLIQAATGITGDLDDRLKALQAQLTEKESIVVNINIEKTKLLEEIENLRQNQKAMSAAGSGGGNSDELLKKIRELEARLEEYSLFEDDLANLKRLQQENLQLKKKLEEIGTTLPSSSPKEKVPEPVEPAPALAAVPEPAPEPAPSPASEQPSASEPPPASDPTPVSEAIATQPASRGLDQSAIDALLEGKPATPPESTAPSTPQAAQPSKDEFENLVTSVETSLETKAPVAAPVETAPASKNPSDGQPAAAPDQAAKSDEDLLKEFESLLNS